MAHSLFNENHELKAQPCTEACPHLGVFQITKDLVPQHRFWSSRSSNNSVIASIDSVSMGMNIPKRLVFFVFPQRNEYSKFFIQFNLFFFCFVLVLVAHIV